MGKPPEKPLSLPSLTTPPERPSLIPVGYGGINESYTAHPSRKWVILLVHRVNPEVELVRTAASPSIHIKCANLHHWSYRVSVYKVASRARQNKCAQWPVTLPPVGNVIVARWKDNEFKTSNYLL